VKICRVMAKYHADQGNVGAARFWDSTLQALNDLQVAGMSDKEEMLDEEGKKVTRVYSPAWQKPTFDELFDQVDVAPSSNATLFNAAGRPRTTRIRSHPTVKRMPPQSLPASYFREGYVQIIRADSAQPR
ncbi:hypothetical protein F5050DRAFT_1581856, partial [Lentinula boryana]